MPVEQLIDRVIGKEGGYSNHPADKGGPTRWGITQEAARAYGYQGDMKSLPREEAVRIYKFRYWLRPNLAAIAEVYPAVAEEMFDTGVNMGEKTPIFMLQRLLNALNREGRDYGDLKADGDFGPLSVQNLKAYKRLRGEEGGEVLRKALNCIQGERYVRITEGRPANEAFLYGWLKNRVEL